MSQAHAERAHALLGASKAKQWLNCTPSARLQDGIQEKRSEYAAEGEVAHELAENKLRRRILPCNSKQREVLDIRLNEIIAKPQYGTEMEGCVQAYVDAVEERYMEAKARSDDAIVMLEESLDFSVWVPEGRGTGDVVIISDGILDVIDLKYGKGVPETAIGNPQLRLYGLAAWGTYDWLYGVNQVRMTIIQPRLDSITTDIVDSTELVKWAEEYVRPRAELAFKGEGEPCPGDHCRWCKVKATCRARADENMKALAYEFQDPALLTIDEIGSILFVAEELQKWAKDVSEYAYEQAVTNKVRVPGWKLVEGRSNRTITDKVAAIAALVAKDLPEDKYLKPQELLGIGDLEKKLGKTGFKDILGPYVIKPTGKPALVPEGDSRPELGDLSAEFAGEEFG